MSTDRLHSQSTGATKPARRLAFSTPMGVSAVAVVAVAIIAGLLLFDPRGLFDLGFGASPTPLPSLEPTSTVEPTSTPRSEPTPAPTMEPTPTLEPTPTPVPVWTGLEWSEAITPGFNVFDAIWWNGSYVGVGYAVPDNDPAPPRGETHIPVFLSSVDGVSWTIVQELQSYVDDLQSSPHPVRVVRVGEDRLVAMSGYGWGGGPRTLWESSDGMTWTLIDSPSWRAAWGGAFVLDIAGGPAGAVAIGAEGSGCCASDPGPPIVLHSTDGHAWEEVTPTPEPAKIADVASHPGGFVVVGSVGERDVFREGFIGTGVPAIWVSPKGVEWTQATIEGAEAVRGGEVNEVAVGCDGLFAIGYAQPVDHRAPGGATRTGWSSSDGNVWTYLGEGGDELPSVRVLTSDGTRMIILGPQSPSTTTLAGWTSTDGAKWTTLKFSGAPAPAADLPAGPVPEYGVLKPGYVRSEWPPTRLTRDGVVAYGWIPPLDLERQTTDAAWVARATEP